jgi:hypothetical protein
MRSLWAFPAHRRMYTNNMRISYASFFSNFIALNNMIRTKIDISCVLYFYSISIAILCAVHMASGLLSQQNKGCFNEIRVIAVLPPGHVHVELIGEPPTCIAHGNKCYKILAGFKKWSAAPII